MSLSKTKLAYKSSEIPEITSVNSMAGRTQINPGSGELALVILAVAVQPNRLGFEIAVATCLFVRC